MSQDIQIRFANHCDIDVCVELLEVLFDMEKDFEFDQDKQRKGLELILSDSESRTILVAENGHEIVGMCCLQILPSTAEGAYVMLFEDFIVHESFRGRKIGDMLLERAEVWGREKGATRFQLLTDRNNQGAIAFYEKRGWEKTNLIYLFKH